MIGVDVRHFETSWEEKIKPKKYESLHKLEDSMEPTLVLKIVEGVEDLCTIFHRKNPHYSKIYFLKEKT